MPDSPLARAFGTLDDADAALVKLDKLCCEPGRSQSMAGLAETLSKARVELAGPASEAREAIIVHLEDAGAQLGRLQVGCCAENRLPLYARMLEDLTKIQLEVNRVAGLGH